jgi:hypothetical protein
VSFFDELSSDGKTNGGNVSDVFSTDAFSEADFSVDVVEFSNETVSFDDCVGTISSNFVCSSDKGTADKSTEKNKTKIYLIFIFYQLAFESLKTQDIF